MLRFNNIKLYPEYFLYFILSAVLILWVYEISCITHSDNPISLRFMSFASGALVNDLTNTWLR